MANISVSANPEFPDVYQWDLEDDVIGGEDGAATRPIKQLTERTAFLKKGLEQEIENREEADGDLQDQIDDNSELIQSNTTAINSVKGRGGYLMAYDFGTHEPSQEDLNAYALSQIHSDDPLDIWNGTHVKNIYVDPATIDDNHPDGIPDNHVWALTNTPDTDPPTFEWINDGYDSISVGGDEILGVVKGTPDPGDESKNSYIKILPGGSMRTIGDMATVNGIFFLEHPVGCFYEQYPDAPTPVEVGWPGTWEVWSSRAIIYGLRSTNSGSASIYIERQKCGNLLTASDLAVGAQVSSGAYAGYYVREVVTLAGKFISIEGGNRPAFVSGGVGQDQIRSIDGSYEFFSSSTTGVAGINPKGSITIAAGSVSYYNQISSTNYATTLFKINTPNPGPDVAPKTLSARYWRRIA